jgi:hypothetical protein
MRMGYTQQSSSDFRWCEIYLDGRGRWPEDLATPASNWKGERGVIGRSRTDDWSPLLLFVLVAALLTADGTIIHRVVHVVIVTGSAELAFIGALLGWHLDLRMELLLTSKFQQGA